MICKAACWASLTNFKPVGLVVDELLAKKVLTFFITAKHEPKDIQLPCKMTMRLSTFDNLTFLHLRIIHAYWFFLTVKHGGRRTTTSEADFIFSSDAYEEETLR